MGSGRTAPDGSKVDFCRVFQQSGQSTVGIVDQLARGLDALDGPFEQLERNVCTPAPRKVGDGSQRRIDTGCPIRGRPIIHVPRRTRRGVDRLA